MNRIVGYRLSGRRVLAIGKCAQCTILELLRRISGPVAELPQCWVSQPVCVRVSQHWVKRLPSSLNLFTYTLFCPYQMSTCSWWLHLVMYWTEHYIFMLLIFHTCPIISSNSLYFADGSTSYHCQAMNLVKLCCLRQRPTQCGQNWQNMNICIANNWTSVKYQITK